MMQNPALGPALRAVIAGVGGILSLFGLIPEGVAERLAEHADQSIGAILVLWSMFAAMRAKKEAAAK